MALELLSEIGKERFKTAIFKDANNYLKDGNNNTSASTMEDIIIRGGYSLSEDIVTMPTNTEKTIITFATGHYVTITTSGYYSRTNYTDGYIDAYYVSLAIYNSNKSRVDYIGGDWCVYKVQNGVRTYLPIYLFAAIDKENKKGYFLHAKTSSGASGKPMTTSIRCTGYTSSDKTSLYYTLFNSNSSVYDPDPWSNAGYTGIGGGNGTFDFASDALELPELPNVDATDTGFLQLYSASLSQVKELSNYLWTDDFLTNLVKVTQDPLSIIMSLYMYPFIIPSTTTRRVRAGNIETPVTMSVPDKQYHEINCGDFPVPSFYGAYLDYEPFAKCEIFLPYCGTHTLSLDDIVGTTLNVRYRIDLLSGSCVAFVLVDGCVRYVFNGMCAMNIPITSQSFISMYSSILGVTSTITGANGASFGLASDVASNVMGCKPSISHGGTSAGNLGFMGMQKPTLIFTIPNVAIPKGQALHMGYPVFATYKLSELEGYTEIESILTANFGKATNSEIAEIEKLLKEGVIL